MFLSLVITSSFSERLKEAIGEYSATELANKIGVSKQTISAYITGSRKPKRPTLKIIAETLNVNESWLLGCNTPKNHDDYFIPYYYYVIETLKKMDDNQLSDFLSNFMPEKEIALVFNYRELNKQGQERLEETLDDMLVSGKYKKSYTDEMALTKEAN